jgi:hypothetical protein
VTQSCPDCGASVLPDDSFCGECGGRLSAPAGKATGSPGQPVAAGRGSRLRRILPWAIVAAFALVGAQYVHLPGILEDFFAGDDAGPPAATSPGKTGGTPSYRPTQPGKTAPSATASRPSDVPELYVGEFTFGGCATVCEDVSFCRDFDIDQTNGRCTLKIDQANTEFSRYLAACPQLASGRSSAVHTGTKWQLACPR